MNDAKFSEVHDKYTEMPEFSVIVGEFALKIVKYCYNLIGDVHEAQDATQEVFIRAFAGLDGVKDAAALSAWLYRIAYNVCMDILRARRRRGTLAQLKAGQAEILSYEDNYNMGISADLQAALASLKPADRALVYSRAVDEMDYAQLEKIYNVSAATLRKRYERARKRLAAQLVGAATCRQLPEKEETP